VSQPRVSVVIPTYNAGKWVLEAIESVRAQSYSDFEIIVVDDGSQDDTEPLLADLDNAGKIRYIKQANLGVSAARNRGVSEAAGELIAFLDADDLFHKEKLSKQIELIDVQPQLGFVHANFEKFDDAGNDLGLRNMDQFRGNVYPQILQEWSAIIALPTLLLPKSVFEQVGGFDEDISWGEDIDLYIRIARKFEIDLIPETLCRVRVRPDSASASKVGSAESFHRVLEKAFAADDGLSSSFRDSAFAKLYVNKAQNLLGEGSSTEIRIARSYARKALGYAPGQFSGWFTFVASWMPQWLRTSLVEIVRRWRYPRSAHRTL
jgi:glycosyltransferase involved in cell wall biosynthesis